jgi:hypothetical protein
VSPTRAIEAAATRAAQLGYRLGPVEGSGLGVSGAEPGPFPAGRAGTDQTVSGSLTPWVVEDFRSQPDGWHVMFHATAFRCQPGVGACPSDGDVLPAGSLFLPPPAIVPLQDGAARPSVLPTAPVPIDVQDAVTVASASAAVGPGLFLFVPGQIGAGHLQLAIPSHAFAAAYEATITVTIAAGP